MSKQCAVNLSRLELVTYAFYIQDEARKLNVNIMPYFDNKEDLTPIEYECFDAISNLITNIGCFALQIMESLHGVDDEESKEAEENLLSPGEQKRWSDFYDKYGLSAEIIDCANRVTEADTSLKPADETGMI